MKKSFTLESKVNCTTPAMRRPRWAMAKIRPPTTGAGMQHVLRNSTRLVRNRPTTYRSMAMAAV